MQRIGPTPSHAPHSPARRTGRAAQAPAPGATITHLWRHMMALRHGTRLTAHVRRLAALAAVLLSLLTSLLPAGMAAAAPAQQGAYATGTVVSLKGTPHLWFVDGQGTLHWGGDTRALAGHDINWNSRVELSLDQLKALPLGDPWLSAGLLKDGEPIYLVKWESNQDKPTLLHIQSLADVALFGINGSNYGQFVLDRAAWEQRYGMPAASLTRAELPSATPAAPAAAEPGRYYNKDLGFSIQVPSGWSAQSGSNGETLIAPANGSVHAGGEISRLSSSGLTLDDAASSQVVAATILGAGDIAVHDAVLGGVPAKQITYSIKTDR